MTKEHEQSHETSRHTVPTTAVVMLPCPFCGETKALRIASSYEDDENGDVYANVEYFAVFCDAARANGRGPGGCGATSGYQQTEDLAVERWNKRHDT